MNINLVSYVAKGAVRACEKKPVLARNPYGSPPNFCIIWQGNELKSGEKIEWVNISLLNMSSELTKRENWKMSYLLIITEMICMSKLLKTFDHKMSYCLIIKFTYVFYQNLPFF